MTFCMIRSNLSDGVSAPFVILAFAAIDESLLLNSAVGFENCPLAPTLLICWYRFYQDTCLAGGEDALVTTKVLLNAHLRHVRWRQFEFNSLLRTAVACHSWVVRFEGWHGYGEVGGMQLVRLFPRLCSVALSTLEEPY